MKTLRAVWPIILVVAVLAYCYGGPSREVFSPPTKGVVLEDFQYSSAWKAVYEDQSAELQNLPVVLAVEWNVDSAFLEATVKNPGIRALQFSGYRSDIPQQFQEVWVEDKWETGDSDWCGTGMEQYELSPGEERVFRVNVFKSTPRQRILALFREEESGERSFVVLATQGDP